MTASLGKQIEENQPAETPSQVYTRRLAALTQLQNADQRREKLLGYAKLIVAAVFLTGLLLFLHYLKHSQWLIPPVLLFVVLALLHDKLLRRIGLRNRAINFYNRGLARLEDRWSGTGESGECFVDPLHPYARDLDIFGTGSLFELLCTARTRSGEETLANWLLAPAPATKVQQRNQALLDLKGRIDFHEQIFCQAETMRLGIRPGQLSAWGERSPIFTGKRTRITTRVLAALWLLSLVIWAVTLNGDITLFLTFLNYVWSQRLLKRSNQAAEALERAADGLALLAGILQILENEPFQAPRLIALQASLNQGTTPPSAAIRRLCTLAGHIESRHNLILRPLNLVAFWSTQLVFAAESWQQKFGPQIRAWLQTVGEFEALTALAGYAYEHPADVFPELAEPNSAPLFEAEALAHPLLPVAKTVTNDFKLGDGLQLLILSGPNMAGKSTFIRSIGINAVLAQCGAPVRASRLRLSPLTVAASICILDSLSGGVSRFYAEIHRVKLISDLADGPIPVLFLLDELLSGTNSHDRLAGSAFIVRSLVARNAIGIVSTHDLALTRIPDEMGARAVNYHFEDRFENGQLIFDYKLKPGVVKTSNALELMRAIGLKVDGPNPSQAS